LRSFCSDRLYVSTQGDESVVAVKASTDLTCGGEYRSLFDREGRNLMHQNKENRRTS
jgi:hypothetical protein